MLADPAREAAALCSNTMPEPLPSMKNIPDNPTHTIGRFHVFQQWQGIAAQDWDALPHDTPFTRYAYLAALEASGSACPQTGWGLRVFTLWQGDMLAAACVLYLKSHSHGEYVFDWAWASAYARHGLNYYPKAVAAVPFTPVPGKRILGHSLVLRQALLKHMLAWCKATQLSSLHLLFLDEDDATLCQQAGLMLRSNVQFHWCNQGWADFDDFLSSLNKDKRKKIRQERQRVAATGMQFKVHEGTDISSADWDFFYACYTQTYWEHGNAPYLSRDFFTRMQNTMPENWVLFLATYEQQAVACSLIGLDNARQVAYGRYWGALARVSNLHFEACYYQPLAWCIANRVQIFEGGAQGEHKVSRALLPVPTRSAHWVAHSEFAKAIANFLKHEQAHIQSYLEHLAARKPFKFDTPDRSELLPWS